MLYFLGAPVRAWSRTQDTVSLSSGEAEAYALLSGAKELLGANSTLNDIGMAPRLEMCSDSTSAISMQSRAGLGRNKHMQMEHLYLQQLVRRKVLTIKKIGTEVNTSDLGTKCLERPRFEVLRRMVGITGGSGGASSGEAVGVNVVAVDYTRLGGGNGFADLASGLRLCYAGLGTLLGLFPPRGA